MPLLNRKIDYALLILCYLHHKTEGGCAREIAQRFGISRPFVANILKDLCGQGYVQSHRGVKGGYALLPQTAERTLADLIDALDDTVQLAECNAVPPEGCCDLLDHCPIRVPIGEVHRRIREVLEGVKLVELFHQSTMADRPLQLDLSRCEK
ncbi:MAG: Rrf2 family transcriptional regulator [Planctomycetes bacterium]|nr:Rrf2 family transcriptional regulator [Planctomycetota bacterium]